MEIYERIKHRRKELGLTADAVADALGVSRATVYRYESADIEKLPITAIKPLSEVLKISPAYLMGWTEDPGVPTRLAAEAYAYSVGLSTNTAARKCKLSPEACAIAWAYEKASEGIKDSVAKLLDMKRGEKVQSLFAVSIDADGKIVEYSRSGA